MYMFLFFYSLHIVIDFLFFVLVFLERYIAYIPCANWLLFTLCGAVGFSRFCGSLRSFETRIPPHRVSEGFSGTILQPNTNIHTNSVQ